MTETFAFQDVTEPALARWAERIAIAVEPGDCILLDGELGAGKTTFARGVITALSGDALAEIPSPTFAILQSYDTARIPVAHYDLYRLNAPEDLIELGAGDRHDAGLAIVEWPDRAGDAFQGSGLRISLSDGSAEGFRNIAFSGFGPAAARLERVMALQDFLDRSGWSLATTKLAFMQGDASSRRYARIARHDGAKAILMDSPRRPDGPAIRDNRSYSSLARLAEDVTPFVAIAQALGAAGASVPVIAARDLGQGFLIIEDLGDKVFGAEVQRGASQADLWQSAIDVLVALQSTPPPETVDIGGGTIYRIPAFDHEVLAIETELLLDWYVPAVTGRPTSAETRQAFDIAWSGIFARLTAMPRTWVLRDFHSPNLIALPGRSAPRDVGLIDFQDALLGPEGYDLVSLLQDARLDVPRDIERRLFQHYATERRRRDRTFDFDEQRLAFSYAALGAQRNTKILGIFARLAMRDGKRQYLAHLPRIWTYLERDLEHPDLAPVKNWYQTWLPQELRRWAYDASMRGAQTPWARNA